MATLPTASVTIDDTAGAFAGGTGYCVVMACAASSADTTPRVFASTKALLAQHGYSPGVDYCSLHFEKTKQPIIFIGLPVTTAGAASRNVFTGTGSSAMTVTGTIFEECDVRFSVVVGGTIGVSGITFNISVDGGQTTKLVRLGTASTYVIPYVGITLNFAAGTLVAGDTYAFVTSAPMWGSSDLAAAEAALAAQLKLARSFMVIGDLTNSTFAGYVTSAANAYETAADRFVVARAQVRDRHTAVAMLGAPTITFAEVGVTGDTITRSTGSFITDGFQVGDTVTVAGAVATSGYNNVTGAIASLSATVITLGTTDLINEGPISGVTITKAVETKAAHVAAMDTAFASVDAQRRIDLGIGRARVLSPITAWEFRRPVQWAASIREYSHDVQIPCWRKSDGPIDGFDMTDGAGNVVEFDERTDSGALAARFTCFRTYSNGPNGAFVALSLTRATEGSLLSRTHNMAVANVACTVTQAETENAIGQVLILNDNGTGTEASLSLIEQRVNSALAIALLQQRSEGQRASKAVWTASKTDVLSVPAASLTGVLDLELNGTLEQIVTSVRVR